MELFDTRTYKAFADGRWAGGLCKELKPDHLREVLRAACPVTVVPGWECKSRIWQATHQQWVQFEPENRVGPFFSSGKLAILSTEEALYAGYYVESGLLFEEATQDEKDRGQVMDESWHWNGFRRLICEEPESLFRITAALPPGQRCVWLCVTERQRNNEKSLLKVSLGSEVGLRAVIDHVRNSRRGDWIDLIVGVEFTKDECEQLQFDIVPKLVQLAPDGKVLGPLVVASELHYLVTKTLPLIQLNP
jgi:hypothetical protein